MKTVTLYNRITTVKLSSTLQEGMSDMLRFKQKFLAHHTCMHTDMHFEF